MARISFKGYEAFGEKLKQLEHTAEGGKLLEDAARAGANPVADEIRNRLANLPEDEYRYLAEGETFSGLSPGQKRDLDDSLGIAPVVRDKKGFVNAKVGFDGYGSFPTKTYPQGVPNALIARAVESGSSVRQKSPFVRPAVRATRKEAIGEMDKVITDGIKKIFKE